MEDARLNAPSIGVMQAAAVERWGARVALRRRRQPLKWSVISWTELGEQVRAAAAGLLAIGVEPGDRVAMVATTRVEWTIIDYAILAIGAVGVPIYHSNTADQVTFVLRHSGARVAVVEDQEQLEKVLEAMPHLPRLKRTVVFDVMDLRQHAHGCLLDELYRDGRRFLRENPGLLEERMAAVQPDWLATIVYTSGTTGVPKGVRLTHANLMAAIKALDGVLDVDTDDTTVLCLPLSHIYARLAQYAALSHGFCIAYAARVDLLGEVLREVRPTFFFGVPRIYERIYHEVVSGYRDMPALLQGLVRRGIQATRPGSEGGGEDAPETTGLAGRLRGALGRVKPMEKLAGRAGQRLAEKTIFGPVRQALGGRVRFCVSGGAPLNIDVARFFEMAGVEILEGYGLTETVGATTLNPLDQNRPGTVGRPLPGIRLRIAPDGEVLISGDMVFEGYHDDVEETRQAFTADGWLQTGDIGRLDPAGFLVITDRSKDLLITSGAKNVAPQQIETVLRGSSYIAEAMVFGDRRPYLVALLTLEPGEIRRFAAELDMDTGDWATLVRDPRIVALVEAEVERCNGRLARFERVRRFRILPRSLTVAGGELTPTLKIRRTAVAERYRTLLEELYEPDPV
jgi:long-chain acyl-CoA synthetase